MSAARTPRRHLLGGAAGFVLLIATFGVWSTVTTLHGAVVTTGELVYTDGATLDILHPDGGTVSEVFVQAGDLVDAGTVIARMDGTLLDVERRILEDRLFQTKLRDWRIQALLDGATSFPELPVDLQTALDDNPDRVRSLARERSSFESAQEELSTILASLTDAQQEAARAAAAARAVAEGLAAEVAVIDADLERQRSLQDKGLAQWSVISNLERARIQSDNARLQSLAEAEAQTARQDTLALDMARQTAAYKARQADMLAAAAETIPELEERIVGLAAQQERLEVRAPVTGHLNTLAISTPGVIVMPGTPIATLVPNADTPHLLAPIAPQQIDQVWEGQTALLRPMTRSDNDLEISAEVIRVGEAVLRDPVTGASYYEVSIAPKLDTLRARGDGLVSGTPFEVAIQTSARSPLSYLMEPVQRSFRRALRE